MPLVIHDRIDKGLIPVMLMPYKEDGSADMEGLNQITDFYLEAGAAGLFANCYSTEMYQLSHRERMLNAKQIVSQVNGKVPVLAVGTFADTTGENIELIKRTYDTGVDAVIMVSSKIVQPTESDDVFIRRLNKIFQATEGIPLGMYECPFPYKRIVTPEVYKQLIPYDRIIYHKDTSCDINSVCEKLQVTRGSNIQFYEAHMPNAVASLRYGATGLSAIAGNYYPEVLAWVCKHYNNPEHQDKMKFMEAEFKRVDALIHEAYPVSAKYFLQLRGVNITSKSRWYTESLTDEHKQRLRQLLHTFYNWCDTLSIPIKEKTTL